MKQHIHSQDQLTRLTERISSSKLPITVEVKKYVQKRSNPQNRLVHKWFGFIAKEFALAGGKFYTPAQWKDHLKELFGYWIEVEMLGKTKMVQKSTADYDVKEMSTFMEKVDHYCGSEFHIFLPSPNVPDENEYK